MEEHRLIEKVLAALETCVARAGSGQEIDRSDIAGFAEFFREFADRCHHGKEEDRLFPLMEARGFSPDQGPTAVMREEHVTGRKLIGFMDEAIDGASKGQERNLRAFVESATAYVAMLREHIQKEDHCLFPMADQALTPADQQALFESFEGFEREELGGGVHERYLRVADRLAERFGVPKGALAAVLGPRDDL
jgi:hemerythrin-like domain-containing protein